MIELEYRELFSTLIALTEQDVLNWRKDDLSQLGFFCLTNKGQKFLIDKFYSVVGDNQVVCLSLTIFKEANSDTIIDEINLAPVMKGQELENFELLKRLYRHVEVQYSSVLDRNKIPVLSGITQSLQRQLKS